ncbi:ABC transporter substrate-binding protein [Acidimangrovimonas sediminis]|uniref:ABC transporter substrate-binding protein n=1 Tax=Acidimangrovimonas sediminis TaxID=2056283 RepID=UPI00130483D8|nr:ABC transporter substrate-binding protein [Acidimangrovimonas sediminis]
MTDHTDHKDRETAPKGLTRRKLLTTTGGGALALGASQLIAPLARPAFAAPKPIKIGLVAPKTGQLAIFYKEVPFVMDQIQKHTGGEIEIGGQKVPYEFVIKDSQSNPNRASQVTQDLIFNDGVDLVATFATPETVNPVSDQCEANGVPCIATDCPLESYYFGRGAPKDGFEWTYCFFFSLKEQAPASIAEWDQIPTNKVVGALWPNGDDGHAYARTYPPLLKEKGYKLVDPGRFDLPSNYSAQIAAFKAAGVEVISAVLPPPEFVTFWNAAAQQGFKPKIAWVGKATEFPPAVTPLGARAENLSIEVWWTPAAPFTSGLTGITSQQLADSYEKASGEQWSMTLGIRHALFEVVFAALKGAKEISASGIRDAIKGMKYASIAGPIDFTPGGGPFPNTAETPLAIGQWRKGDKFPLDLKVVANSAAPQVPVQTKPQPIAWN